MYRPYANTHLGIHIVIFEIDTSLAKKKTTLKVFLEWLHQNEDLHHRGAQLWTPPPEKEWWAAAAVDGRCTSYKGGPLSKVCGWQAEGLANGAGITLWFTIFIFNRREINYSWPTDGCRGGRELPWLTLPFLTAPPARGHYIWPCDARRAGAPRALRRNISAAVFLANLNRAWFHREGWLPPSLSWFGGGTRGGGGDKINICGRSECTQHSLSEAVQGNDLWMECRRGRGKVSPKAKEEQRGSGVIVAACSVLTCTDVPG